MSLKDWRFAFEFARLLKYDWYNRQNINIKNIQNYKIKYKNTNTKHIIN